jgi:hypothetical protein
MHRPLAVVALLASLAVGCAGTNPAYRFQPQLRLFVPVPVEGKSDDTIPDNEASSDGSVARPQSPPTDANIAIPDVPVAVPDRPIAKQEVSVAVHSVPVAVPDAPVAVPGSVPVSWPAVYGDEHRRDTPTVRGELLGLNPAENGVEKAVELARRNEQLQAEIKALQARIAGMEVAAKAREEAVAESVRETEAATVEVIRARADLQATRKALATAKERLKQAEEDELETLKLIVMALEKLLAATKE